MKTAVVAIGGNAILKAGEEATLENQLRNLNMTCSHLARMIKNGYDLVIIHGNGPQVGNILLQNELCKTEIPPMPLDVCVAESQGLLGYLIQQSLASALAKESVERTVTCIVTRVLVDPKDPAFEKPSKPIGPYYSQEEAEELRIEKGWTLVEDIKRGGYRRVVPSPRPISILESDAIKRLIHAKKGKKEIVVAAGGGGIPVVKKDCGYEGVEAVVDKDFAASVLARDIGEKTLIFLTDIDHVYVDFGTDRARPLKKVTLEEIEEYVEEQQFPPGSMGPKVQASIDFLRSGGRSVIITSPALVEKALSGKAGTRICAGR
ncbi:MAG: carbamate kinase [Methanomassiliicoccales archaeon]|jgi:carbamate kinase|nr:carbamate kinase [Methanomassiliicoccales archaeon]